MFEMKKKASRTKSIPKEPQSFWAVIKRIRKEKGMTQEELAEALSESADGPWISRVESGKKDISLRSALKIVHALGAELFVDKFKVDAD